MKIHSHSPQETFDLAKQLGQLTKAPFVVFLKGNLGTGKTLFTQGFAQGIGIKSRVNSPTFVMMKIYEGTPRLVHVDAYRLEHSEDIIGIYDELDDNTVMIVEWPEHLNESIKPDVSITLEYDGEHNRIISIESHSECVDVWRSYVATHN